MPHENKKQFYSRLIVAAWCVYFLSIFARILWINEQGIYAGHTNVWSDWSLHIGQAMVFAEKSPSTWFAYHPMYADGRMTYTFLTNLISGLLMRAGLPLTLAFILPSIALSIALLLGMFFLFRLLCRSEAKAALAISLFFLGSGLGFLDYLQALFANPSWATLLSEIEISRMDDHQWYSGNFVVGHLVPQRSFLLGLPMAIWSLVLLLQEIFASKASGRMSKGRLAFAGILAGLLPIAHAHSLIALCVITAPLCLWNFRNWKLLLFYVMPAGMLASTLYFTFIAGGIPAQNFMGWHPGYTFADFGSWLLFWGKAWGPMIPFAAFALIWRWNSEDRMEVRLLWLTAFALFILANLFRLQPILWDNSKILLWVYLLFAGLAAEAIVPVWRTRAKALAPVLMLALCATGFLELTLLQRIGVHSHQMISASEMEIARKIRTSTGPLDRFLTAPVHNSPVMMMGARPILMGFTPWVMNFGFPHEQIEADIAEMYQGGEKASELLRKHNIRFIYVGSAERGAYRVNEKYLGRFPIAFQTEEQKVYDVSGLR